MNRVVEIGKHRWLAGMTWSSFEDAPNRTELKEDAERLGASWVCVRIGEAAIQAGFSTPVENIKRPSKLNSLAAMLADSQEQPWLGIFKITDGVWWYVAVRDGHAILPDGDVIGCEEDILAARERHSGYTDWKYIEGDIDFLEELIQGIDAKRTPIRSLSGGNLPATPLIVSSIALVSALVGGYWWWDQQQQVQEQERVIAMAKMRAQLSAGNPPALVASPLLTTPQPNDWLSACNNILAVLPLSQYGWALDQVACGASFSMVRWVRGEGATVANKPEGNLSPQGNTVDQIIPFIDLNVQGKNDAINFSEAKIALQAWAQSVNFNLVLSEAPIAQLLPGAEPIPKDSAIQAQVMFKIDMPISPFGLDMSSIPGLRLTSLRLTDQGSTLEGILYGR